MIETLKQGIVGLALLFGNWISPTGDQAEIEVTKAEQKGKVYILYCRMDMAWNRQLEKLVDAGIPLQFRMAAFPDRGDSLCFYRTLKFNIVEYTYTYVDSSQAMLENSKEYPMVFLALKDFSRWKVTLPVAAASCRIEAAILPSRVSTLNRRVDMSRVWGQKRVVTVVDIKEKVNKK